MPFPRKLTQEHRARLRKVAHARRLIAQLCEYVPSNKALAHEMNVTKGAIEQILKHEQTTPDDDMPLEFFPRSLWAKLWRNSHSPFYHSENSTMETNPNEPRPQPVPMPDPETTPPPPTPDEQGDPGDKLPQPPDDEDEK